MTTTLQSDLARVLVSEEDISTRLKDLGAEITQRYREAGIEEITVIAITNGSIMFAADLLRHMDLYAKLDCVRVSSYREDTSPTDEPEIIDNIRLDVEYQDVLLLDDILDTGRTISKIISILRNLKPASLNTCVLLNKHGRREVPCEVDFAGFDIPDEFVVGYGLDFAERYRNLPCIGVLKPELQNPPEWQ